MGFFKTKEEFVFTGTKEELEKLVFDFDPRPKLVREGLFAIYSNSELGTFEGSIMGIYNVKSSLGLMLSFKELKPGKIHITLSSKRHLEHYFILLIYAIALAFLLESDASFKSIFITTIIWLVVHFGFQHHIHNHEIDLIDQTKKVLNLKRPLRTQ